MKIIKVESCTKADKKVFENGKCECYLHDEYTDEHICYYDPVYNIGRRRNTEKELFKTCPLEDYNEK